MSVHDRPPATMPRRQQDAAMTAFVLDVLQTADEIGDASEAEADTSEGGPGAGERVNSQFGCSARR